MAKITAKESKIMNTVRRAYEKATADMTFSELLQATRLDSLSLKTALDLLKAKEENGFWYLPALMSAGVPSPEEVITEKGVNWVVGGRDNAPDVTPQATLINPNTGREYVELPETGQTIKKQILEQVAQSEEMPEFELQPPPIYQKHFILIENCHLSLAQDGTGQEPALAKDTWLDDEGEELEKEEDRKFLCRAVERPSNEIEFRGVTYRNLFIVENAQLFHGIFDDIQSAKERMDELMAKKPSNHFELLEI